MRPAISRRNEVAADQGHYGKQLLVTGVVASINSGLGNRPYITLRGPQYVSSAAGFVQRKPSQGLYFITNESRGGG